METTQGRGALYVPPGEGRSFWLLGELFTVKAVGEDTGGEFAFAEAITPPHIHHREDETFWVLEGEFEFLVGEETMRAPAGSFVHAPKDIAHTYKNVGTTPGRYVATIRPAGLEEFFLEVSDPAEDPSAPPPTHGEEVIERILAVAPKYGLEILPPPEQ